MNNGRANIKITSRLPSPAKRKLTRPRPSGYFLTGSTAWKRFSVLLAGLVAGMIVVGLARQTGTIAESFGLSTWAMRISRYVPRVYFKDGWNDPLQDSSLSNPATAANKAGKKRFVVRPHFAGEPITLQKDGTTMDVCRILKECFKGSQVYGEFESCWPSLRDTLNYYDSAFIVDPAPASGGSGKGREQSETVAGFISIHTRRQPNATQLLIYNVCVGPEYRQEGVAKLALTEFIPMVLERHSIPTDDMQKHPVLLALDVDLESPMAAEAFSLYVKLGFVRWMSYCKSVSQYGIGRILETLRPEKFLMAKRRSNASATTGYEKAVTDSRPPSGAAALHNDWMLGLAPFQALVWNPHEYVHNAERHLNLARNTHFCMFKMYRDSFFETGRLLKDAVTRAKEQQRIANLRREEEARERAEKGRLEYERLKKRAQNIERTASL